MSDSPPAFPRALAAIVLVHALLVLPWLGRTTLLNIDEGRISEVAREMVATGDWLTPRIGGEPFGGYPPLGYWLMAVSGALFGFNEFAMRLPAALAAIGMVALVGSLVRRLSGPRAGLAAAAVLATLPAFLLHENACRLDGLAALFAVLALDRFLAWAEGERRPRDLYLMYGAAGLGILSKGPISIAVVGLGGLAWFFSTRRWALLKEMRWLTGVPLTIAIAVPWYVLVARAAGPNFLRDNLLLENADAFVTGHSQKRPVWYYLTSGIGELVPWVFVLAAARPARGTPGLRFFLYWFVGVFLFLTVSSAKRLTYLVYLCPALAAAAGATIDEWLQRSPQSARRVLVAVGVLGALAAVVVLLVPSTTWKGRHVSQMTSAIPTLAGVGIAGAALIAVLAVRRGAVAGGVGLCAFIAGAFSLHSAWLEPMKDADGREAVAFCRRVSTRLGPTDKLLRMGGEETEGAYFFYMRQIPPVGGDVPGLYFANDPPHLGRLRSAGRAFELLEAEAPDDGGNRKILIRLGPSVQ